MIAEAHRQERMRDLYIDTSALERKRVELHEEHERVKLRNPVVA
jgi:hypothetical protein